MPSPVWLFLCLSSHHHTSMVPGCPRHVLSFWGCSPQTMGDITAWTSSPGGTYQLASCRYTPGETRFIPNLNVSNRGKTHGAGWMKYLTWHTFSQDGCYSEGADQPGEGGVSWGSEERNALQLRHSLPWAYETDVQVNHTCSLMSGLCTVQPLPAPKWPVSVLSNGWFILRNWAHCVCDAVNAVKPPPPPQWSGAPPQNCNFPQTVLPIATQWREKGGLWLADSTSALHYVFPCFYHTGLFWFCDRHCWKRLLKMTSADPRFKMWYKLKLTASYLRQAHCVHTPRKYNPPFTPTCSLMTCLSTVWPLPAPKLPVYVLSNPYLLLNDLSVLSNPYLLLNDLSLYCLTPTCFLITCLCTV